MSGYYFYMAVLHIKSVVWKEGKVYVAQSLGVDISSFGKTKKEAKANLQEALELYFEDQKPSKVISIERPELTKLSVWYA